MEKKVSPAEIEDRLIEFASRILDLSESLPKTAVAKHLGGQIMRSGTSPALNYGEARAAESNSDFLHKVKVCLKELRETLICLKLIEKRTWFTAGKLSPLLQENNELVSIFVVTAKSIQRKQGG